MNFAPTRIALKLSCSLAFLLFSYTSLFAQQPDAKPASPSKKSAAAAKNAKTRTSTLEQQIEELRQQLQNQAGQIDSLKTGMAAKG